MKRVATEDILQMNSLYFQYKNFAEVARQTGFSASTVRNYVDVNWKPVVSENIIKFDMNDLPELIQLVLKVLKTMVICVCLQSANRMK